MYFGSSGFHALEGGQLWTDDADHHHQRLLAGGGGGSWGGGVVLAPVIFCLGTVGIGWGLSGALLHLIVTFSRQILQVRVRAKAGRKRWVGQLLVTPACCPLLCKLADWDAYRKGRGYAPPEANAHVLYMGHDDHERTNGVLLFCRCLSRGAVRDGRRKQHSYPGTTF